MRTNSSKISNIRSFSFDPIFTISIVISFLPPRFLGNILNFLKLILFSFNRTKPIQKTSPDTVGTKNKMYHFVLNTNRMVLGDELRGWKLWEDWHGGVFVGNMVWLVNYIYICCMQSQTVLFILIWKKKYFLGQIYENFYKFHFFLTFFL